MLILLMSTAVQSILSSPQHSSFIIIIHHHDQPSSSSSRNGHHDHHSHGRILSSVGICRMPTRTALAIRHTGATPTGGNLFTRRMGHRDYGSHQCHSGSTRDQHEMVPLFGLYSLLLFGLIACRSGSQSRTSIQNQPADSGRNFRVDRSTTSSDSTGNCQQRK